MVLGAKPTHHHPAQHSRAEPSKMRLVSCGLVGVGVKYYENTSYLPACFFLMPIAVCNAQKKTTYYDNGQKKQEWNYVGGKLHGPSISWHENGQKSHETNWVQDKPHGLATEWDEDGNITKQTKYIYGRVLEEEDGKLD